MALTEKSSLLVAQRGGLVSPPYTGVDIIGMQLMPMGNKLRPHKPSVMAVRRHTVMEDVWLASLRLC